MILKTFKLSSVLALLTAAVVQNAAFADISSDPNLANFIAELKGRVHTTTSSFYSYHWQKLSPGQVDPSQLSQDELYKQIVASIRLQKEQYVRGGNYSGGYYVALDPATSREYGGTPPNTDWTLTRIEIPAGFRYVDLAQTVDVLGFPVSSSIEFANTALKALGPYCPKLKLDDFVTTGGQTAKAAFVEPSDIDRRCLDLLNQIVQNLNVDGLFYSYGQTAIPKCDNFHQGAIVFTRADWLRPSQIRSFSRATTGNTEERQFIQSFLGGAMYYAPNKVIELYFGDKNTYQYMKAHPEEMLESLKQLDQFGGEVSKLIPKTDAEKLEISFDAMRTILRKVSVELTNHPEQLWPDLQQSPTEAEALAWTKEHLLQCQKSSSR